MNRSLLIDVLKVLASQVIVWHHLSLYSPMADALAQAWPWLLDGIQEYGRLAVQPFLVIGGYLAARGVEKVTAGQAWRVVWQRYLRLMPPFGLALLLVLLSTWAMAPVVYDEDWVSRWPTIGQFAAHIFLIHDLLGVPALSAGAWYVAIDLQLFVGLTFLALLTRSVGAGPAQRLADSALPVALATLSCLSITVFSRHDDLDVWAIYFLGSYGLGALVEWSRENKRARWCLVATIVWLLVDVAIEPRARPLVALVTAIALLRWASLNVSIWRNRMVQAIAWGSDVSYGVFVAHFAVIIVASGLWQLGGYDGTSVALAACVLTWMVAVGVGAMVQRLGSWPSRAMSLQTVS
jgi:peptidoglycan/LPS O-acetylase OafA/YrhL